MPLKTARSLRALLLAALMLPGVPASAEEDCSALATQLEMKQCTGRNLDAADAELNRRYKLAVARLAGDTATLALLHDAQRAWIAFRDADCGFAASSVAGGSIYPMIHGECLQAATEARSATLQYYLSCAEGDLSCPLPPQ